MRSPALNGRIVIIGAGNVGATIAYTVLMNDLTAEIVLIDVNKDKVQGEVLDMNHGLAYFKQVAIRQGSYEDCAYADVVVVAAGVARKPGQSRLELAKTNADIVTDIVKNIMRYANDPLLLIVSNPVDVLTYAAQRVSGLSPRRVIGSGTTLDTARFKYLLSQKMNVDVRNVHAYIIGEHGDSEVPVWSHANVAGEPFEDFFMDEGVPFDRDEIIAQTRASGAEVIKLKSATTYGIAMAAARIISCITGNENAVLTVSTVLTGQYELFDVALSLPALIGVHGVERYLPIKINGQEKAQLCASAAKLKEVIADTLCPEPKER